MIQRSWCSRNLTFRGSSYLINMLFFRGFAPLGTVGKGGNRLVASAADGRRNRDQMVFSVAKTSKGSGRSGSLFCCVLCIFPLNLLRVRSSNSRVRSGKIVQSLCHDACCKCFSLMAHVRPTTGSGANNTLGTMSADGSDSIRIVSLLRMVLDWHIMCPLELGTWDILSFHHFRSVS